MAKTKKRTPGWPKTPVKPKKKTRVTRANVMKAVSVLLYTTSLVLNGVALEQLQRSDVDLNDPSQEELRDAIKVRGYVNIILAAVRMFVTPNPGLNIGSLLLQLSLVLGINESQKEALKFGVLESANIRELGYYENLVVADMVVCTVGLIGSVIRVAGAVSGFVSAAAAIIAVFYYLAISSATVVNPILDIF